MTQSGEDCPDESLRPFHGRIDARDGSHLAFRKGRIALVRSDSPGRSRFDTAFLPGPTARDPARAPEKPRTPPRLGDQSGSRGAWAPR